MEMFYAVISRYNEKIANGLSEEEYNMFYYTSRIFHELNHSICRYYNIFDRNIEKFRRQEETFCDELSLSILKEIYGHDFYHKIIEIYNKFHWSDNTSLIDNNGYINFDKYKVRDIKDIFYDVGINIADNDICENVKYNGNIDENVWVYTDILKKLKISISSTVVIICDAFDCIDKKKILSRYENMTYIMYYPLVNEKCIVPQNEIEVK